MTPINRLTSTFDKRWTSYALASGALFVAPAANASIITFAQDITVFTDNLTDSKNLDVDMDGTDDYVFSASALGGEGNRITQVTGLNGNTIFAGPKDGSTNDFAFVVPLGTYPGYTPTSTTATILQDKKGADEECGCFTNKVKGNWNNDIADFQYMGLMFTGADTNLHMGWALVSSELGSAGVRIIESDFDVPEPSSMVMMLLGAAGITALKLLRRRQ